MHDPCETRLLKVQTSSHSKSVMGAHGETLLEECDRSLSLGFDDQNTDGNKGPGGAFDGADNKFAVTWYLR